METSGAALLTGGVPELKKHLEKLVKGGVLFLDEAYQLNPKTNPMGAQVGECRCMWIAGALFGKQLHLHSALSGCYLVVQNASTWESLALHSHESSFNSST